MKDNNVTGKIHCKKQKKSKYVFVCTNRKNVCKFVNALHTITPEGKIMLNILYISHYRSIDIIHVNTKQLYTDFGIPHSNQNKKIALQRQISNDKRFR